MYHLIYTHTHINTNIYVCMYVCMFICMYTHSCTILIVTGSVKNGIFANENQVRYFF